MSYVKKRVVAEPFLTVDYKNNNNRGLSKDAIRIQAESFLKRAHGVPQLFSVYEPND